MLLQNERLGHDQKNEGKEKLRRYLLKNYLFLAAIAKP